MFRSDHHLSKMCWKLCKWLISSAKFRFYTHDRCVLLHYRCASVSHHPRGLLSPPNLIGLTWMLISFPPSSLCLPSDRRCYDQKHRRTRVQCMTQCTLMLIVSAGINSPPHHAGESALSGMAEYPGPLPSPPLLRYPSMVYFCPCVSLLSAKCRWRLSLH